MKDLINKLYLKSIGFRKNYLAKFFIGSPFKSSLYYIFFSPDFRREQYSVLNGKVSHLNSLKKTKNNIYTLIRNTHRIEKGLLMQPRKQVFATGFLGETVEAFISIWKPEFEKSDVQYKWFRDVLEEYFLVSGSHQIVDKYIIIFEKHLSSFDKLTYENSNKSIPYQRDFNLKPEISYEDFYQLTKFRRSVRWFIDKPVPHDLVDKAILAANQSPSACNRQPYHYIIIDNPDFLKVASKIPSGIKGYDNGIKMLVVVVGNLDAYFDERDRHIIYIDASLANMTFMLALETLGLSSCPINWPDIEELEQRMSKILKLEKYQRPIMCMAVGYPDQNGKVAYSEKRTLDAIRSYN
jgi:nitroreductase